MMSRTVQVEAGVREASFVAAAAVHSPPVAPDPVALHADKLVKVVSFWCVEERRVLSYTADIDAAGSTAVEGTIATLAAPGAAHGGKVAGLSSDSGGGGVLEDAARSYVDRGLAVDGPLVAEAQ